MMDTLTHQAHRMSLIIPHDQLYKMAHLAQQAYGTHPTGANYNSMKIHRMAHDMSSNMVRGGFKTHNGFRGNAVKRHTTHQPGATARKGGYSGSL